MQKFTRGKRVRKRKREYTLYIHRGIKEEFSDNKNGKEIVREKQKLNKKSEKGERGEMGSFFTSNSLFLNSTEYRCC